MTANTHLETPRQMKEKEQSIESLFQRIKVTLFYLQENVSLNQQLNEEQKKDMTDFIESLGRWNATFPNQESKSHMNSLKQRLESSQPHFFLDKKDLQILSQVVEHHLSSHFVYIDQEKKIALKNSADQFDESLKEFEQTVRTTQINSNQQNNVAPWSSADLMTPQEAKQKLLDKKNELANKAVDEFLEKKKKTWYGRFVFQTLGVGQYAKDKASGKETSRWRNRTQWTILSLLGGAALLQQLQSISALWLCDLFPDIKTDLTESARDAVDEVAWSVDNVAISPEQQEALQQKREEIFQQVVMPAYKKRIEEATWKTIHDASFSRVFSEWYEDHKDALGTHLDNLSEEFENQKTGESEFHTISNIISTLALPAKAWGDLMVRCINAWFFAPQDIAVTSVLHRGHYLFNFALKGTTFVWSVAKNLFGAMSLEEVAATVSDMNIDTNDRMILWWALYRHGGIITDILSSLWRASASVTSTLLWWIETDQLTAYWKGWIMGDVDKQIALLEEREKSMKDGWLFKDTHGTKASDFCKKLKNNMLFNAYSSNVAWSQTHAGKKSYQDYLAKMQQANIPTDSFERYLKDNNIDIEASHFNYKKQLSNYMKATAEANITEVRKWFFGQMKDELMEGFSYSKASFRKEFVEQYRSLANTYGELVNTKLIDVVPWYKSFKRRALAHQLADIPDSSQKMSFYLETADDAKKYFEQMGYLIDKAPHAAATLLKNAPIILVGKEVLHEIHHNPEGNIAMTVAKWMGSLMPLVGPVMLINESLNFSADKPIDYTSLSFGAMTFAYDGRVVMNAKTARSKLWMFAEPFESVGKFAKNAVYWSHAFIKHSSQLPKLLAQDSASLWKHSKQFATKATLRAGWLAALIAGGYYGVNYLRESWTGQTEKQKILKHVQQTLRKEPSVAHQALLKEYRALNNETEKQEFIKIWLQVALQQRLWLKDPSWVEIGMTNNNAIACTLKEFVDKDSRDAAIGEMTPLLQEILGREVSLEFLISKRLVHTTKKSMMKHGWMSEDESKNIMKKMLIDNGETASTIEKALSVFR